MSSTLTYVYCLVRSAGRPSLRGVPDGVPGGRPVRLIEVPAIGPPSSRFRHWLVVTTVPERMYSEAVLERGLQRLNWVGPRALAHEAVVEHFLPAAGVLPMQLFALFTSDDRAVEHIVRDRRRVARILSRIEGQVEWGLRVMRDPAADASAAQPRGRRVRTAASAKRTGREKLLSGADYLARKREARDETRVRLERARTAAGRLYRAVRRQAGGARRRTEVEQAAPGSGLLLDAAFLVPSGRARAFRAAVRRQARAFERSGMTVSLTGPWPAYNFI